MAKVPPIVQDGILTYHQHGSFAQVELDSSAWYTWLETASTFAFRSEHGSFTARQERAGNRRGSPYWRVYCTREGKLHRVYLGKSQELTFERLMAVATALGGQGNEENAAEAGSSSLTPPNRRRSRLSRQPNTPIHRTGAISRRHALVCQPTLPRCLDANRMCRWHLPCSCVQRCAW